MIHFIIISRMELSQNTQKHTLYDGNMYSMLRQHTFKCRPRFFFWGIPFQVKKNDNHRPFWVNIDYKYAIKQSNMWPLNCVKVSNNTEVWIMTQPVAWAWFPPSPPLMSYSYMNHSIITANTHEFWFSLLTWWTHTSMLTLLSLLKSKGYFI